MTMYKMKNKYLYETHVIVCIQNLKGRNFFFIWHTGARRLYGQFTPKMHKGQNGFPCNTMPHLYDYLYVKY